MAHDHLYNQILSALKGPLNPTLFEECACDLLALDFPGLAPIPGGTDSGMDGAVPDLNDEAFPLICTTSDDVIGNLTGSLDSYLKRGLKRRQAIVATSESLSAARVQNLKDRAKEKGFTLIQVFEQQAIANKLYRSPRWSKTLLNITGTPSALSKVPPNPRLEAGDLLVGRNDELQKLKNLTSDCIISGQPGTGKTYILQKLVEEESDYYFLNDSDKTTISNSLREFNPKVIIIDDVHVYLDRLQTLLQLKRELHCDFKIILVTWPDSADSLRQELRINSDHVYKLRLLGRDEIVEVIKSSSVYGPDWLIREIVNQADGRPGLASLLAHLCLLGDIKKLVQGDLLTEFVKSSLKRSKGKNPEEILAAFAIGGKMGMKTEDVSKFLNISSIEIRRTTAELAAAGIISENHEQFVVRPHTLRFALVRDVFFNGANSLSPNGLIEHVPLVEELAITLLGAAHRGANINDSFLLNILSKAGSEEAWDAYAALGAMHSQRVIEEYHDAIPYIFNSALENSPEEILPFIFEKAIDDNRPTNSHSDHPLRKVEHWIKSAWAGTPQALQRRESLLRAIISWLKNSNNPIVVYKFIPYIFNLHFEENSTDPGQGNTWYFRDGILTKDEIEALIKFWKSLHVILKEESYIEWKYLLSPLHDMIYVRAARATVPEDVKFAGQALAKEIISDLIVLAKDRPGVLRRLLQKAKILHMEVTISEDEVFKILYPDNEDIQDYQNSEHAKHVEELAQKWAILPPSKISSLILVLDKEAKIADISWPILTAQLLERMSHIVESPLLWATVFLDSSLSPEFIIPFYYRAVHIGASGWEKFSLDNISGPLKSYVIRATLTHSSPSKELLEAALSNCDSFARELEYLTSHIHDDVLVKLLTHPSPRVRGYAAISEWHSSKNGKFREEFRELWRAAFIGFDEREYWLDKILHSDAILAKQWVSYLFEDERRITHKNVDTVKNVISTIGSDNLEILVHKLPKGFYGRDLVIPILRGSHQRMKRFLEDENLKDLHLYLVEWNGGADWVDRVKVALEYGYSHDEIAAHTLPFHYGWEGKESEMWQGWMNTIKPLLSHDDTGIKNIAKKVCEQLQASIERALKRETKEAIYGRG